MYISRKRLIIMSITILMMILLSNIFGIVNNKDIKYGITTARVNLRKNPNLDSNNIIRTLNKDENLKIINEIHNFYIVQLPTNEFGLISKDYINIKNIDTNQFENFEILKETEVNTKNQNINIRTGPGTNFSVVTTLNYKAQVRVIGKINDWYLVITPNNYVGFIRNDLIELQKLENENALPNTPETILNLINEERKNKGLPELIIDNTLNAIAKTKAKDMISNNYFAHESPTYGLPFKMIQDAKITYKTAGENIAGNRSVANAVNSWLSSEPHKQNLLSNAYNYIGIGLEKSDTYGYVIVVMFIGK